MGEGALLVHGFCRATKRQERACSPPMNFALKQARDHNNLEVDDAPNPRRTNAVTDKCPVKKPGSRWLTCIFYVDGKEIFSIQFKFGSVAPLLYFTSITQFPI